jgi:RecB family exonuclease
MDTSAAAPQYFSTSEEQCLVNCRLAHTFQYELGYAPAVTNSKLSLGIIYHKGFEAIYLEHTDAEVQAIVDAAIAERRAELTAAAPKGQVAADIAAEFIKDSALVKAMVADYRPWVKASGVDVGWSTVSVEEKLEVQFPGTPVLFRGKLDLLQRSDHTGRLRVVDAKTRAQFYQDTLPYQLSEQNGNYQLAVMAVYGERPTEMAYREARKMNPKTNPKSKPPYYREVAIRLTKEEMLYRAAQFAKAANIAKDPDRDIYANPGACCGSWKNDWSGPCQLVHQGRSPQEALEESPMYQPKDPYLRYEEEDE